jgi:hypothetical protein
MNRKPRSDSKLDTMPESRVLELRDGMITGWSHEQCKSWLAAECSLSCSGSALTNFYKRHCLPLMRESRQLAAVKAEAIVDEAGRTDWNTATLELVKQVSFEMMSGQKIDAKTSEKFIKLILKADKQDTDKQKFELLKAKAMQADQAKGVAGDNKLTDEEKAAELKRIFRMG